MSGHPCGTKPKFSERWDAYYCPGCDVWLEPACQQKDCSLCTKRPDLPSQGGAS